VRTLEKAGFKKIFREKVSGGNRERSQFQRMLYQVRGGDTIVVWKLDRLARSTRDLLETMDAIREAGAKFQSLSEPWADTTTHAGKMIMTIFAGIAEFERDLIRERTGAGRDAARKRGVRFGRPRKLSLDQEQFARRLVVEGKSVSDIARTFSVHVATIYRPCASAVTGHHPSNRIFFGNLLLKINEAIALSRDSMVKSHCARNSACLAFQ
jgi:DNA invertase Pin-like site-specific DNA recombinase